jgi:opacity protein-like surface antigen
MTRGRLAAAASLLLLILASPWAAAPARAETLLTAFGGISFGGATDKTRGTYGAALGFLGDGPFGFELEFATTPEFFGNAREDVFSENNVLTMMGSFLLATPRSDLRFYAAFGGGLMKTRLQDSGQLFSIDSNDFGINVGGGLIGSLSENVALRVDFRYFRDVQDPDPDNNFDVDLGNVDYWRAVGGITFKF